MVEPGTILELPPSDTIEVLATPAETGDRYRVRLTTPPGGGPGIRGFGPHTHPGLIEVFQCVSGTMTARLGRDLTVLTSGDQLEVPPGEVHGFKNTGEELLVVDNEIVFTPPGPRPEADLMAIGVATDRLARQGKLSRITGYPKILQLAVMEAARPEAQQEIGLARLLIPGLAVIGRTLGYQPDP